MDCVHGCVVVMTVIVLISPLGGVAWTALREESGLSNCHIISVENQSLDYEVWYMVVGPFSIFIPLLISLAIIAEIKEDNKMVDRAWFWIKCTFIFEMIWLLLGTIPFWFGSSPSCPDSTLGPFSIVMFTMQGIVVVYSYCLQDDKPCLLEQECLPLTTSSNSSGSRTCYSTPVVIHLASSTSSGLRTCYSTPVLIHLERKTEEMFAFSL